MASAILGGLVMLSIDGLIKGGDMMISDIVGDIVASLADPVYYAVLGLIVAIVWIASKVT